MVSSQKIITNVVSRLEGTRKEDLDSLQSEFQESSRSINDLIESWKRKIIETGSITNYKKSKVKEYAKNGISDTHVVAAQEKPLQKVSSFPTETEHLEPEELNVKSMKVTELREHLRQKNLDDRGLKKVLQERLQECIDEQVVEELGDVLEETEPKEDTKDAGTEEITEEISEPATEDDVEMIDSISTAPELANVDDMEEPEPFVEEEFKDEGAPSKDVSMESVVEDGSGADNAQEYVLAQEVYDKSNESAPEPEAPEKLPTKSSKKATFGKKIKSLFSPSKIKKSPMKQARGKAPVNESIPVADSRVPSEANNQSKYDVALSGMSVTESLKEPSKGSNDSRYDSSSTASSLLSTTSNTRSADHLQPMITPVVPTKTAGKMFLSSTAQAKMKTKEERKARLDEIRNKVKKNQESVVKSQPKTAVKDSTSSASSQNSAENSAEERKKAIAAKMRQKLALNKPVASAGYMTPSQPPLSDATAQVQLKKQVMSPVDTYEMSDREESDSGEESDEYERSPKKKIPKWAQKQNLKPMLERQFCDGPHRIDPDSIFHEVSSCDLEAIFGKKKQKYSKRKSTGDWRKDRVTISEKHRYKQNMGFK